MSRTSAIRQAENYSGENANDGFLPCNNEKRERVRAICSRSMSKIPSKKAELAIN